MHTHPFDLVIGGLSRRGPEALDGGWPSRTAEWDLAIIPFFVAYAT